MKLSTCGYALPVRNVLTNLLESTLASHKENERGGMMTLNYRDPNYSPRTGGYHPVEIALLKERIVYITEFSYAGCGGFSELVIELDFEFQAGVFTQMGRQHPIESSIELFEIWQQNFCHYASNGIYEVEVTRG